MLEHFRGWNWNMRFAIPKRLKDIVACEIPMLCMFKLGIKKGMCMGIKKSPNPVGITSWYPLSKFHGITCVLLNIVWVSLIPLYAGYQVVMSPLSISSFIGIWPHDIEAIRSLSKLIKHVHCRFVVGSCALNFWFKIFKVDFDVKLVEWK